MFDIASKVVICNQKLGITYRPYMLAHLLPLGIKNYPGAVYQPLTSYIAIHKTCHGSNLVQRKLEH